MLSGVGGVCLYLIFVTRRRTNPVFNFRVLQLFALACHATELSFKDLTRSKVIGNCHRTMF